MTSTLFASILSLTIGFAHASGNGNDCGPRLDRAQLIDLAERSTRDRERASRNIATMFEGLAAPARRPGGVTIRDARQAVQLFGPARDEVDRIRAACFTGGMRVSTPRGQIPIRQLAPGDQVFSFDLDRQAIVISTVTTVKETANSTYGILRDLPTPIEVTETHRFFAEHKDYREVSALTPRDVFIYLENPDLQDSWDGLLGRTYRGDYVMQTEAKMVHEISLGPGPHNYFLEGVLVHNVKEIGI